MIWSPARLKRKNVILFVRRKSGSFGTVGSEIGSCSLTDPGQFNASRKLLVRVTGLLLFDSKHFFEALL
jgi:hypothetical protein